MNGLYSRVSVCAFKANECVTKINAQVSTVRASVSQAHLVLGFKRETVHSSVHDDKSSYVSSSGLPVGAIVYKISWFLFHQCVKKYTCIKTFKGSGPMNNYYNSGIKHRM